MQTFQVIINKNGNITFQYKTLNSVPTDAVVGIESQEGLTGVQYPTNDLANAKAIRLTYSLSVGQYTHDSVGNPSTITNPLSHTTRFTHDATGNLISVTDPLSHTTQFTYDAEDRVLSITNARLNTTQFSYNSKGNLTTLRDANNQDRFGYCAA